MPTISVQVDHSVLTALDHLRIYSKEFGNGKRFVVGDRLYFDGEAVIEPYTGFYAGKTLFGMGSFSYSYSQLDARQRVGRYCSIAENVRNIPAQQSMDFLSTSKFNRFNQPIYQQAFLDLKKTGEEFNTIPYDAGAYEPAEIRHDVSIGEGVLLGRNLTIGSGAIITANSVVTEDVPPYAIVGGAPAKIIGFRFSRETIQKLLALKWWHYSFTDFHRLPYAEPDRFADQLKKLISINKIEKIAPDSRSFGDQLLAKILELGKQPPEGLEQSLTKEKKRGILNRHFPVPRSSTNWHSAELDERDGTVFRFFAHKAWLEVEVDASSSAVEFVVYFAVKVEAIDKFEVMFEGQKLPRKMVTKDALGRNRMQFALPRDRVAGKQLARMELVCSVSRTPSQIIKGSKDTRILSIAVSPPKLIG